MQDSKLVRMLGLDDATEASTSSSIFDMRLPSLLGMADEVRAVLPQATLADLGYPALGQADADRAAARLQQTEGFFGSTMRGIKSTLGGENTPFGFGAAQQGLNIARYLLLENKLRSGRASEDEQREHLDMFTEFLREPGIREMAGDIVGAMPGLAVDVFSAVGMGGRAARAMTAGTKQAAVRMIRDRAADAAQKAIAKRAARTIGAGAAVAGGALGVAGTAALSEFAPQAFGLGGGRWTAYALQKAMPQLTDMSPEDWEEFEGLANGALVSMLAEDLPLWQGALDNVIEISSELAGAGIARGLRATLVGAHLLGAQKFVLDKIAARVGNRGADTLEELGRLTRYDGPIVEMLEERLGDVARVATGLEEPDELFPELPEFVAEVLALTFPAAGAAAVRRAVQAYRPEMPVEEGDFRGERPVVSDELQREALTRLERAGVKGPRLVEPSAADEVEAARWAASRGRSLVLFESDSDKDGVGGFALAGNALVVRRGTPMGPLALTGHELQETVALLQPEVREAQRAKVESEYPGLLSRALAEWKRRVGQGGAATQGDQATVERNESLAVASEWVAPLMAFAARNDDVKAAVTDLARQRDGGGFWRGVLDGLRRVVSAIWDPNSAANVARSMASRAAEGTGLSVEETAELSQLLGSWIDATELDARDVPDRRAREAQSVAEQPNPVVAAAAVEAETLPPARERSERERQRDDRERARRLAAIPLPGDVVMLREAGTEYTDARGERQVTYRKLTGRVLETLDGGRRLKVRVDEDVTRAFEQQRSAAENRARRAELVRVVEREQVRIERREEPPQGSVRARLRDQALRELQGLEVEGGRVVRVEDAEAERAGAEVASIVPRVGDLVRVTARGKQGLADVLAELRGGRLRVRLRPDEHGGALARSGSSKNRTVEVEGSEVELFERRAPVGARAQEATAELVEQKVAEQLEVVERDDVVPGPPERKAQPQDWPGRASEEPREVPASAGAARVEDAPGVEGTLLRLTSGNKRSAKQGLDDKRLLRAFNLDARKLTDDAGVIAENMTDQPKLTLSELRRAWQIQQLLEPLGARGEQTKYQGNKSAFLSREAPSLAMALATRQDAETVFAMYAGGGSYELSIVGAGALPKVRRVVVNEIYPPRRWRLELALKEEGAFLDEWKTNPTLVALKKELETLTAGKSQTLARDALRYALGVASQSTNSMYKPWVRWKADLDGLPIRARAALQAYFDIASVERLTGVTVDDAIATARRDMATIKRHADRARARGVEIEVVGLNAYGEDAIAMVQAAPGSVVFLDPPYHRTDQGTYIDEAGVEHDLSSDEQAAAFTYGAVQMAGDNLVIYHNNATPEVRDMLHSQLADRMHLRLWRRTKKTKASKQDGLPMESAYEWTAYLYGRSDAEVAAEAAHPRGPFEARFEPGAVVDPLLVRMLEMGSAGAAAVQGAPSQDLRQDFDPFTGLGIAPRAGERLLEQSLQERLALRSTGQRKARPLTMVDYVLSMGGLDLREAKETNATLEWAEAFRESLKLGRVGLVGLLKEASSTAQERGGSADALAESLYEIGFRDPREEDGRMSMDTMLDAMLTEINGGLPTFPLDNQIYLEQEFARQEFLRHEQWALQEPAVGSEAMAEGAPLDLFDLMTGMDAQARSVAQDPVKAADDEWVPFAPLGARRVAGGRIRRTISELVAAARGAGSWRDWYTQHESVMRALFVEDVPLVQKFLAATSAATNVPVNVALALKAYGQHLRGEPFTGYMDAVAQNLYRAQQGLELKGPKVGAFAAALAGDVDAVVVDRHIAQLLFNVQVPNNAQRLAAQERLRLVAQQLGWEPRQVQAALWAFNQVRQGVNPATIASYDTYLEQRREAIAALRTEYSRGEGGGVRAGAAAAAGVATDDADRSGLAFAPLAWHISPARFDQFDTQFVGSGVGAQRRGWGLYFHGAREFVEGYRLSLTDLGFVLPDGRVLRSENTRTIGFNTDEEREVGDALFAGTMKAEREAVAAADRPRFIAEYARVWSKSSYVAQPWTPEMLAWVDAWVEGGGQITKADPTLYRVDIAPEYDAFLRWRGRWHEQPGLVRDQISDLRSVAERNLGAPVQTGEDLYLGLVSALMNDDPSMPTLDWTGEGPDASRVVSALLLSRGVRGTLTTFNENLDDAEVVLFSAEDVTISERFAPAGRMAAAKARKLSRAVREYLVSDVLDVEDLQAEIAQRFTVGEEADFVGAIDLARSKAPARMDALLGRMLSAMQQLKGRATLEQLQRLVYVKTAPARNAWLRVALADRYLSSRLQDIRKQVSSAGKQLSLAQLARLRGELAAIERVRQAPGPQRISYVESRRVKIPLAPSGIDDMSAMRELAALRQTIGYQHADAFLEFIREENARQLQEMVDAGLLQQERADEWHQREPYYVSLRDLDEDLDNAAGAIRVSRAMAVRGPLFARAKGRVDPAERVLEAWLEDKLRRHEHIAKNEAMRSGAALARVDASSGMEVLTSAPRGEQVAMSVPFFEGGQQRWLLLPSASAAETLKGLHGRSVGPILEMVGVATRAFSRAVTSRNPFFWLPNFLRDTGAALWTLTAERSFTEGAQVMARAWSVLPHVVRHALGKSTPLSAVFEQAAQDGLKTTWLGAATLQERLRVMHDALSEKGGVLPFVRRAIRAMDAVSEGFELATRVAMYQHELARGKSRREAALFGKNLTVNFDKKGTLTSSFAALYSFFNPAVQGSRRIVQAALSSRRSVAVTTATVTLGLVWEMLAYGMSDDDEATGEPVYGMLADWSKDRNLHLPFTVGGVYLTYPMPYLISSIFGFGRRMAHLLAPGLDQKVSRSKAVHDAFWQVINEFQPLGDVRDPFVALAPTITKPFVELERNLKFGNRPIQRDRELFGVTVPNSARAFSTLGDRATGWIAQHIADVLNAGGPADVETGLDVSPASIQHLLTWLGAGFGLRELDRVSQFGLSSRDVPVLANTPLVRNFTNAMSSHAISENYYELRARADSVWRRAKDLRGAPREAALSADPELYRLAPRFRAQDRRVRALTARMAAAGRDERRALQEQRLELQAAMVREYYGALR